MRDIKNIGLILFITVFLVPVFTLAQEPAREQSVSPSGTGEVSAPPAQETQPVRPVEPAQLTPPNQPNQPDRQIQPMPLPPQDEREGEDEEKQREYVDPREIRDVLRQISQQKSEIKRLLKAAQKQKMSDATTELQSILAQITQHEQAIRGAGDGLTRDTLQEFYEAQIWESIEKIRYQVQLPQELKQIEKELKRVESLLKQKATAAIPNLNLEAVRAKVAESRTALEQAKSALASGDNNDAVREAMEVFWQEGGHPGEIMGTLSQLREVAIGLKRIKSAEVREAILDILSPVFESINDGDFREARMQLENLKQELLPLMRKAERLKSVDDNLQQKIQQLEQKLEDRSSGNQKVGGPQSYVPYWYNQRASIFDAIRFWFGF